MSAHDSILATRVKQIRDANRKRQEVPFKKGDFVYLSNKNISFPEGLAQKLIPKYISPYKILDDFNNQSFKIDLPPHLKQRGIHNVFHSSLLKIHIPNDDRLFPGRMDTQLGVGPEADNEWAVDKIISHARSGQEAVFEILWKAGNITWLPYYQIRHLQALDVYLDLLDIEFLGKLPNGKGKPPHDNAQIFLGAISLRNILPSNFTPFSFNLNTDSFFNFLSFLFPCLSSTLPIEDQPVTISLPYSLADDNCHFV